MDERNTHAPSLTPPVSHQTWAITKPQVQSTGGIVAAQHHEAAQIGADILAADGLLVTCDEVVNG